MVEFLFTCRAVDITRWGRPAVPSSSFMESTPGCRAWGTSLGSVLLGLSTAHHIHSHSYSCLLVIFLPLGCVCLRAGTSWGCLPSTPSAWSMPGTQKAFTPNKTANDTSSEVGLQAGREQTKQASLPLAPLPRVLPYLSLSRWVNGDPINVKAFHTPNQHPHPLKSCSLPNSIPLVAMWPPPWSDPIFSVEIFLVSCPAHPSLCRCTPSLASTARRLSAPPALAQREVLLGPPRATCIWRGDGRCLQGQPSALMHQPPPPFGAPPPLGQPFHLCFPSPPPAQCACPVKLTSNQVTPSQNRPWSHP